MIENIQIENLRSIHNSGFIELKPIMILLGANSSGKSTFLRSFPLFTQSVEKKLRGPISWFDAAYVDFGDYKTAKNKYSQEEDGITFTYQYKNVNSVNQRRRFYMYKYSGLNNAELVKGAFSFTLKGDSKGTYVSKVHIETVNAKYDINVNDRNDFVKVVVDGEKIEIEEKLFFNFNTSFEILPTLASNRSSNSEKDTGSIMLIAEKLITIFKEHCDKRLQYIQRFDTILLHDNLNKDSFLAKLKNGGGIKSFQKSVRNWTVNTQEFNNIYKYFLLLKLNSVIDSINNEIALFYHKCDYIAPMRAEADRFYRIQGLQVQSVDPSGHNLLEFIASLTVKEKASFDVFVKDILGVTVDVPSESGMKSLRIKTNDGDFSIADVGYGYSQVLPVITKLWHTTYIAENSNNVMGRLRFREFDKTTLLMEQPELHLHPAMQAKVADTLIKTVNRTREAGDCATLIVETHSQALINRLGRRIRENEIMPDDINVLLFYKDKDLRNTQIKQISFSQKGQLNDWPYGFFDPLD